LQRLQLPHVRVDLIWQAAVVRSAEIHQLAFDGVQILLGHVRLIPS